jgi:CHAT domain-containing protein
MKKYAVLVAVILCSLTSYAQSEPTRLELKKPVEREISNSETHLYQIKVPAQHYLVVTVNQKVDVIVTVRDSTGKKIQEVDNPFGIQLAETVREIPETETEYFLEVKILDPKSKPGSYKIEVDILRPATPEDHTRMVAEGYFAEGDLAFNRGTAEGYKISEEKLKLALPLFQQLKDKKREHYVIDRLGRVAGAVGDKKKSQEYHFQALKVAQEMGDPVFITRSLDAIGVTYYTQGESRKAIEYWTRVLAIYREKNDQPFITATLNNIGAAHNNLGEYAQALENYFQVVEPMRERGEKRNLSYALANIGVTLSNLGQHQKALDYLMQSLEIAREIKDKRKEPSVMWNLGTEYSLLNEEQKAIDFFNQALPIEKETGNKYGQVANLNSLGYSYYKLKDYQKALEFLNQGFEINKTLGLRNLEASLQYQSGLVYAGIKDYPKAREFFSKARESFEFLETGLQKYRADYMMAQMDADEGKLDEAQAKMKPILEFFESARKQFIQPEQRATYFSTGQTVYENYIGLLMKKHQNGDPSAAAEAFQTSEKTRARSLLEIISQAKINVRQNASPELLERETYLRQLINDRAGRLTRLLSGKFTAEQKAAIEQELAEFRREYQEVEAKLLVENKRYAELVAPVPLSLREIQQQVLDTDTTLLEYSLGQEKSYLFVVTKDSLQSFELPKLADIKAKARPFFEALTARNKKVKFESPAEKQKRIDEANANLPTLAEDLSQTILAPAQSVLTKKRLLIVADDILQYIPFAALPFKNKQPLVANYEIVSLPSASTLAVLRKELSTRKPAAKTVAVLADPVFSDSDERYKTLEASKKRNSPTQIVVASKTRGTEPDEFNRVFDDFAEGETGFNFSRLPFTKKEAEGISTLVPQTEKKLSLDFSANRANATNPELSNYRIIHFATHSFLNSQHPELSGIVLSLIDEEGKPQNGFLRTDEIYNLNLPAELVVLSGCRTGLGKEIRGEGLVGLTRGFMYAGAKRVAVSLWDISDEATAELMTRFYRSMLGKQRLSPAAALRQAQLSMSKDNRWRNPYYWAGFILQGEPK